MKKFVRKAKVIGEVFVKGTLLQFERPNSLGLAATVGLYQGLKYNGSLARGVKAGAVTLAVFGVIDGVRMVLYNIDYIKNA